MKNKLITEFEWDRKSTKIDIYANKLLKDSNFVFDRYKDEYIGEKLVKISKDKTEWKDDYFIEHISLLNSNFSKERLLHCLELREHIDGIKFNQKTSSKIKLAFIAALILVVIIILLNISSNSENKNISNIEVQKNTLDTQKDIINDEDNK